MLLLLLLTGLSVSGQTYEYNGYTYTVTDYSNGTGVTTTLDSKGVIHLLPEFGECWWDRGYVRYNALGNPLNRSERIELDVLKYSTDRLVTVFTGTNTETGILYTCTANLMEQTFTVCYVTYERKRGQRRYSIVHTVVFDLGVVDMRFPQSGL